MRSLIVSDGSKHVRRGRRSPITIPTNPPVRSGRVESVHISYGIVNHRKKGK